MCKNLGLETSLNIEAQRTQAIIESETWITYAMQLQRIEISLVLLAFFPLHGDHLSHHAHPPAILLHLNDIHNLPNGPKTCYIAVTSAKFQPKVLYGVT